MVGLNNKFHILTKEHNGDWITDDEIVDKFNKGLELLQNVGGKRKIRKHIGIIQKGGKRGKLKKSFYYTGKRTKKGLPIIKKVSKN